MITRRNIITFVLAAVLGCTSGCRPSGAPGRAGITLAPPASWRPVKPAESKVPGVPLAAWTGPESSLLVLYRTLPAPGGSAKMIGDALANRLTNLPGLTLVVHQTEKVGEITAARVEVVAPGTGNALAPSGTGPPTAPPGLELVPTREVTLGFVHPEATYYLTWDIPESAYTRVAGDIKATLETLRFASASQP